MNDPIDRMRSADPGVLADGVDQGALDALSEEIIHMTDLMAPGTTETDGGIRSIAEGTRTARGAGPRRRGALAAGVAAAAAVVAGTLVIDSGQAPAAWAYDPTGGIASSVTLVYQGDLTQVEGQPFEVEWTFEATTTAEGVEISASQSGVGSEEGSSFSAQGAYLVAADGPRSAGAPSAESFRPFTTPLDPGDDPRVGDEWSFEAFDATTGGTMACTSAITALDEDAMTFDTTCEGDPRQLSGPIAEGEIATCTGEPATASSTVILRRDGVISSYEATTLEPGLSCDRPIDGPSAHLTEDMVSTLTADLVSVSES